LVDLNKGFLDVFKVAIDLEPAYVVFMVLDEGTGDILYACFPLDLFLSLYCFVLLEISCNTCPSIFVFL
jgi:hypothetical protein